MSPHSVSGTGPLISHRASLVQGGISCVLKIHRRQPPGDSRAHVHPFPGTGVSVSLCPPCVAACHSLSFTPAVAQELPRGELTLTSLRGCDTQPTSTLDVGADNLTEGHAREVDGAGKF